MNMPGKLQKIESALSEQWGSALPAAVPDLVYQISRILTLWGRTDASLPDLWQQLDSLLFNTIYLATERTMTVILDNGQRLRVTTDGIRDMADRLLSFCYQDKQPSPLLKDALFDLARAGSYAAMRELAARYPLDEDERAFILRVLGENDELL